jgi:hypothetical protein
MFNMEIKCKLMNIKQDRRRTARHTALIWNLVIEGKNWKELLDQIWLTGTLMYTHATAIRIMFQGHFMSAPDIL